MSITHHPLPQEDRRLDWKPLHDSRSLDYPIRTAIGTVEDQPKMWWPGPVLDQGSEGACVGFGWCGELIGSPRPDPTATKTIGDAHARDIYHQAKQIDEWAGEDYSGTSVLAGAKAVRSRGYIDAFRWAFSIEDVRDAAIAHGPVVIGIPWYEGMYSTTASGFINVGGRLVGGHCLLVWGYHPGMRIKGEDWHARFKVFRVRNSWNTGYGNEGDAFLRYEDLRDLLNEWGEACVPMGRHLVRLGGQ